MKLRFISIALSTAALLLSVNLSLAADAQAADASKPAASEAQAVKEKAKAKLPAKNKTAAKVKLVDINGASSAELKKLPGVDDATAAKIIAGRPYGSKAWLVSHNIVDRATYEGLKENVIAKQPNRDAAKNAALYTKKK